MSKDSPGIVNTARFSSAASNRRSGPQFFLTVSVKANSWSVSRLMMTETCLEMRSSRRVVTVRFSDGSSMLWKMPWTRRTTLSRSTLSGSFLSGNRKQKCQSGLYDGGALQYCETYKQKSANWSLTFLQVDC